MIEEGEQEFFTIFAGSSVTAGHDNYLNESYPEVYERRMRPALEALGIKFTMHNIAMVGFCLRVWIGVFRSNLDVSAGRAGMLSSELML